MGIGAYCSLCTTKRHAPRRRKGRSRRSARSAPSRELRYPRRSRLAQALLEKPKAANPYSALRIAAMSDGLRATTIVAKPLDVDWYRRGGEGGSSLDDQITAGQDR